MPALRAWPCTRCCLYLVIKVLVVRLHGPRFDHMYYLSINALLPVAVEKACRQSEHVMFDV